MSNPNYDAIPNSDKVKTDESMIVFTGRVLSVSNDRVRNNELLNQSLDYVVELEIISVSEKDKKVKTSFDITMGYMSKYWQELFSELNITEPETFEFNPAGIQFNFQSYTHDKIAYGKVGTLQKHDMVEIQCKRVLRGKIIRFDDKLPTLQEFKKNLYPQKADNYIQKDIMLPESINQDDQYKSVLTEFMSLERVPVSYHKLLWFILQDKFRFLPYLKRKVIYTEHKIYKITLWIISAIAASFLFQWIGCDSSMLEPQRLWDWTSEQFEKVLKYVL